MTVGPDELIARARALVPALRERAAATESARRIPDETVAEIRAAGLFRVLQPRRHGGFEGDLDLFARLVLEIGRGCGSTAWVYSVVAMHAWHLGMFPAKAQDELWGADQDAIVSSAYAPSGAAVADADGYRLEGTWAFASACDVTSGAILGARIAVAEPGGPIEGREARPPEGREARPPEQVFMFLPRADYRIDDNWHVVGLAGTGSKNVVVDDAFVPRHRVMTVTDGLTGKPPGIEVNDAAIYRVPFFSAVGACLCVPAISIARAALEEYIAATRSRVTRGAALGGGKQMAELPTIQLRVAEAAAMVDAAETIVRRDLCDTQATVAAGAELTPDQRLRNRRNHAFAARLAQQAVDRLFESAGGQGLFSDSRVQRAWRDVHGCVKHVSLNWDAVGTLYGRWALGVPLEGAQF